MTENLRRFRDLLLAWYPSQLSKGAAHQNHCVGNDNYYARVARNGKTIRLWAAMVDECLGAGSGLLNSAARSVPLGQLGGHGGQRNRTRIIFASDQDTPFRFACFSLFRQTTCFIMRWQSGSVAICLGLAWLGWGQLSQAADDQRAREIADRVARLFTSQSNIASVEMQITRDMKKLFLATQAVASPTPNQSKENHGGIGA
jgi:hypothetical protein